MRFDHARSVSGRVRLDPLCLYYEGVKEQENNVELDEFTLGWALCFEAGLGLLALVVGQFTDVWPAELLWPVSPQQCMVGLGSAIPPLLIMLSLRRAPLQPLQDLNRFVDERLTPIFRGLNIGELALLSLAAGWGEELLFRGLLQAEFGKSTDSFLTGILIASFVFGLVHFLTPAYFVMAFLISLYFGWLFVQFESLWVPILGHAGYDFLMLVYMQRADRESNLVQANVAPDVHTSLDRQPDAQSDISHTGQEADDT